MISLCSITEDNLRDNTVTKNDENEDAGELRERFSESVSQSSPPEVGHGLSDIVLGTLMVDEGSMFCVRALL